MSFERKRLQTHVVLRAVDSQEGTSWTPQCKWPFHMDSEPWAPLLCSLGMKSIPGESGIPRPVKDWVRR